MSAAQLLNPKAESRAGSWTAAKSRMLTYNREEEKLSKSTSVQEKVSRMS